jgi:ATP-dependent DNA ligase
VARRAVAESYEDGEALWRLVCERGLEGVVAKRLTGTYPPGRRGWIKVKNRNYWRYPFEVEAAKQRSQARP